jgi:hypothetical protein
MREANIGHIPHDSEDKNNGKNVKHLEQNPGAEPALGHLRNLFVARHRRNVTAEGMRSKLVVHQGVRSIFLPFNVTKSSRPPYPYYMMKQIVLLGTVVLSWGIAGAAPLERADVAANPSLLAHFDCDGFKATAIGKAILAQVSEPDVASKLDALQAFTSFDPRTQLHGLTCYTTGQKSESGVLLLYADFDSNRLVAIAQTMPNYHCLTNGPHPIHNWIDEKKKSEGKEPNVSAAILGKRVIFGQSESAVAAALDVLDGKAPSLAGAQTEPRFAAGDFLQGVVNKFDFASKDPNSAILKGCKTVRVEVSEIGDHLAASVNLQAADEDKATQIASIAQGLLALGKLQQDKSPALKLANSVSIKQDGANVSATLSIPEAEAVDLIKSSAAEKAKHKSDDTNSEPAQ